MAINRMEFLLFYSIFIIFVVFISGMAAVDIIDVPGIEDYPQATGAWWEIFTLPFTYFGYFLAFMGASTEFAMIFVLILTPFFIGIVLLVAEMIRGN